VEAKGWGGARPWPPEGLHPARALEQVRAFVCESVVMRPLSLRLSLRLSTPGRRSSAAAAGLVRSCRRPSLAVPVRSPATIDRPRA
jgi:hypothetical protein